MTAFVTDRPSQKLTIDIENVPRHHLDIHFRTAAGSNDEISLAIYINDALWANDVEAVITSTVQHAWLQGVDNVMRESREFNAGAVRVVYEVPSSVAAGRAITYGEFIEFVREVQRYVRTRMSNLWFGTSMTFMDKRAPFGLGVAGSMTLTEAPRILSGEKGNQTLSIGLEKSAGTA